MLLFLLTLACALILFAVLLFFQIKQKNDIERQLSKSSIEANRDFMEKMEFLFNSFARTKEDGAKQTLSMIEPVSKTLDKLQKNLDDLQRYRIATDSNFSNNFHNILELQKTLNKETTKLANVFKKTHTRGKWGEFQLKRIIEIVGMLPFCEFQQQNTDFEGIRPDVTVNLPNGGYIFIDAKTPLEAYLRSLEDGCEIDDSIRKDNLKAIKNHIYTLSVKKYWEKGKSPDFVVMFIPVESVWLSATEEEPVLMEYAVEKHIVVATPMTLIGLLKTIFMGWTQVKFAEEADNLRKSVKMIEENLKKICEDVGLINKYNGLISNKTFQIKGSLDTINSEISNYTNTASLANAEDDQEDDKIIEPDFVILGADKKDV